MRRISLILCLKIIAAIAYYEKHTFASICQCFSQIISYLTPVGLILINSAALLFTKFEIFNHLNFDEHHILLSINLKLHLLNYTTLRRYLRKNSVYFTSWLVHLYVSKEPWKCFSQFFSFRIHVYVEINKLNQLQ